MTTMEGARRVAVHWATENTPHFETDAEFDCLFRHFAEWEAPGLSLEIGAYYGWGDVVIVRALRARHELLQAPRERLVALDPCERLSETGGKLDYHYTTFANWHEVLVRWEVWDWVLPVVATTEQAFELLAGLRYRIIFVDGDHMQPSVDKDIEFCRAALSPGGVALFHDCRDPEKFPVPYDVLPAVEKLTAEDEWELLEIADTLRVVRRNPT